MKLIASFIIISFILFSTPAFADSSDKKVQKKNTGMVRSDKQMKYSGAQNSTQLVRNDGPKIGGRGNTPKDVPGRNTHYMGSQGGMNTIQTGRTSSNSQSGRQTPSGPSWMKKQDDKKKGSINDLSRENQLKNLADPAARLTDATGKPVDLGGDKLKDRPRGKAGLTGGDGTIEVGRAGIERGYGKNQSSKQEQQGYGGGGNTGRFNDALDKKMTEKIYDRDGNYMGTRGELAKKEEEQQWGGVDPADRQAYIKDNEEFQKAGMKDKEEAKKMQDQQEKEMDKQQGTDKPRERNDNQGDFPTTPAGDDTVAKPAPDSAGGGHAPSWIQNLFGGGKKKSPEQVQAEKKRQVTIPGETGRREMDPNAVGVTGQDITNRLTAGKIDPVDGDGTTTGTGSPTGPFAGGQPRPGGPDEGRTGDPGTGNED